MRMWMVNPRLLCRQHLLGEHNEIHQHRHVFAKGLSIGGRRGQIEPSSMSVRHDALAAEMLSRGYRHSSPYAQPDLSGYDLDGFVVNPTESLAILIRRCPACRAKVPLAFGTLIDDPVFNPIDQMQSQIYSRIRDRITKKVEGLIRGQIDQKTERQVTLLIGDEVFNRTAIQIRSGGGL